MKTLSATEARAKGYPGVEDGWEYSGPDEHLCSNYSKGIGWQIYSLIWHAANEEVGFVSGFYRRKINPETVREEVICPRCKGHGMYIYPTGIESPSGIKEYSDEPCESCNGTGKIKKGVMPMEDNTTRLTSPETSSEGVGAHLKTIDDTCGQPPGSFKQFINEQEAVEIEKQLEITQRNHDAALLREFCKFLYGPKNQMRLVTGYDDVYSLDQAMGFAETFLHQKAKK